MYSPGDCVLIETDYYEDGKPKAHLFVVVLEAKKDSDKTAIIPMGTIPESGGFYDNTTVLNVGDHDFVKRPTYINYELGKLITKKSLDSIRKKSKPPVNPNILRRILAGITDSEFTSPEVRELYMYRNL